MKKFYFLLITLFCLSATSLRAQVTFTQTSNDDFTQGNSYGTVINNNAVVPEPSLVGGTLNDWEATTNIPATLYGHQLCTWRNYLYCIGGHNGSSVVNTVYRATFQNSGASNVGISGWTTLTALPVSLRDAAVVSTQNYLIVIGGHNADSICRNIYTAKFNSDGSVAGWSVSPVSLPQPMYGMRAVVAQGNLYIIGGTTSDNASGYSNKVYLGKVNALGELYELTETVTLPVALNRHAVATDGQHVYVTGGRNSSGTRLNSVLKATLNPDGTVNGWQVMAALPAETDGHSAVCSNGVLAVIGGEDNTGLASNKLYYTPTNGNAFNWNIADVFLSDRVKDAASVAYRSSIYVAGGVNMVGTILNYTRYAPITGSSQVTDATFISTPFLIGDPKTIQGLSYTLSNNTSDYQLLYRVAGMDKVYSNWTSTDNSNPLNINISGSFLQYMMRFTSSTGTQPTLEDMTLTLSGITQLSGNLNGMDTLKVENSPYWATGSISFTDGTHVIDSGVTIYFSPNTGLDITRANMKFNGTANAGITLTSYDHEVPNWNGVYFQDASDNGVSSIMNYTSIMYAGNGDNNANLRLYNTNQPVISHCNFQHADGHGLRLVNSHPTLSNCTFSYNTESGVYMEGANPTLNTATCDGNGFAGLYYANANVNPNLTDITLQNNLYGIYSHTPDNSFAHSGSIAMSGNGTDVAVNGGNINGDRRWGYFENGYALLSDVTIRGKLTIAPGNTLKMAQGKYLNIGWGGSEGGKLSAMGKADSLITFTSLNGAIGGWEGLFFRDGSDYNSSSTLRYCVVENGNDRNLYCENTTQPYILSCTFRNANNQDMRLHNSNITVESSLFQNAQFGINLYSSSPILISDTFEYISNTCVRMETNHWPNTYSLVMRNSNYGFHLLNPNTDISKANTTFSNNTADIAVNGGEIADTRTWAYNGTYAILGNLYVQGYRWTPRWTIKPGSTIKFAENTGLQIGGDVRGGALHAIGTPDSLITFTALNDSIGGWNGIYYRGESDDYGSDSSDVKYCIIEKGKDYNLYVTGTRMPYIEDCTFSQSNGYGLWINGEYARHIRNCIFEENGTDGFWNQNCLVKIHDSQFINNGRYGVHYNSAHYVDTLSSITITGNSIDGIIIDGGTIEDNRTWFYCDKPYIFMDNMILRGGGWTPRWTIKPGTTLRFSNNHGLQIGYYDRWYSGGGALHAIGTPDSLITFSALNDSIGGWNGIFYHDYSDNYGSDSSDLKYCIVEKSAGHNLNIEYTQMPYIENCIFRLAQSTGVRIYGQYNREIKNCAFEQNGADGLYSYSASPTITNCTFSNNIQDGFSIDRSTSDIDSSQFTYNGRYGIYANNSTTLNSISHSNSNNNNDGLYATSSTLNSISNSSFDNNNHDGLYATSSTINNISNCSFYNNGNDGINDINSLANILNSQFTNNARYGVHFNSAHYVDTLTDLTFSGNELDGVVIDGGTIEDNRTWFCCSDKPYIFMDNMILQGYRWTPRWTIKPGTTLKFANNKGLQIGNSNYGGALHAIGTPDSLIIFTALNDSIGGWNGIYFRGESDDNGSDSADVKYCIIEKGKDYNLHLNGTKMPYIENCTFRQAQSTGLWIENDYARHIRNCIFEENGTDGLWDQNCLVKIHDSQFINNGRYGVHYNNSHYVDSLTNLTISGNELDGIVIDGGTIEDNRTWFYCEKPYIFMDNITLKGRQWVPVLTLKPGCKLVFANNKGLQIGNYEGYDTWYHFGGALNAIGAPDSLITFSALNNSIGGWNGIYFEDRSDNFGGECHMTYVDVSQGKDYNVRSISTTFPTMEKCNIHHSLGNGMQIESSNCVINSSSFHHNGNHGLFINGGNQPTIGGNYMTYCSFYSNQRYDVYQDGNQTINMPYSFFGTTDSLKIATKKIYDKADNSSKGEVIYWPVSWVPQSIGEDIQLDGTITYGEDGLMNNVTVKVQDFMNNNLLQTTVGATSDFHFSDVNLTTANRMVFEHPYSYADGAVNATDALRVMRHFTHQSLLTPEQQVAADVNGSCTVNGTDAMLILKRYVGLLEEFPVGNCLYICDSVIANDNNFTYNTQMYWYGDVDFSYNFTRGDNSTVQLETYNTPYIPQKNETIRIPVIAKGNYSLGAISLDILYPETEMEIVGVELHQTGDPMTFHTHDNSLRIGWYSLSPLAVSYDDTLLYITARVLQNNPDIRFELGPCCALADGHAEPISGAVLAMPNISDILGVEDIQGGNTESVWEQVQVYPNPSHGTFTISDPEHVIQNLYLYDVCGKLVEIGSSYASESSIRISNLTPGVYFIRMEAEDSTKTLKVVVEK